MVDELTPLNSASSTLNSPRYSTTSTTRTPPDEKRKRKSMEWPRADADSPSEEEEEEIEAIAEGAPRRYELAGASGRRDELQISAVKPAIRLCGKRLRVASDDFALTRFVPFLIQLLWAVTAALLADALYGGDVPHSAAVGECRAKTAGKAFVGMWIFIATLALALDAALIALSLRGTIANDRPRRNVRPLFAVALVVDSIQVRRREEGGEGGWMERE
jgi:hypothetical protein